MKILNLLTLMMLTIACSAKQKTISQNTDYFKNLKGCFLLYNMKSQILEKVIGEQNCRERYPAFSSFKVPLAVIAFDSGVLKDENVVLKWDGVKHERVESNRDHNAKTWMRDSIVWFSQRITSKLGKEKFQEYLNKFDYGNKDISAGLTTAWITPPSENRGLMISAYEQLEFMKKLWSDTLPVSKRAMQMTRDITYLETSPQGFRLHGKTGSNFYDKERKFHAGWFISHLQNGEMEYIAITNLRDLVPFEGGGYGGPRAKQMTKDILAAEGLW